MRIESVDFKNFKLLRDATLPLQPLTVIVGPNGSGKSTVLDALGTISAALGSSVYEYDENTHKLLEPNRSAGTSPARDVVEVGISASTDRGPIRAVWSSGVALPMPDSFAIRPRLGQIEPPELASTPEAAALVDVVRSFRNYALMPERIREPAQLTPDASLAPNGSTLAATLDQMRDRDPDVLAALNDELSRWLPEYDAVLFETPKNGHKAVALRTRAGKHRIGANQLSSGTLLALGLLAIVYGEPNARIIGIEEPEAGIHPRLLRNVFDALLRVAYPAENGIDRAPRQLIVTTHSPYLLDLFKDLPECVVIADRRGDAVTFTRLADRPDVDEIVMAAPLGESWFTGVLGGVPTEPTPPTVYPANAAA